MALREFIRSAVGKGAAPAAQKDSGAPAPANPDAHQGNADGFVSGAADASPAPITTTDQLRRRSAGKTAVRVIGPLTVAALAAQTAGCIYINGRRVSVGTGDGQSTDSATATATTKPVNNEAPVFIGTELSPTLVQAGKDYLSGKDDHPLKNSEVAMDTSVPNHPEYRLDLVGTYMPDPGGNGNGSWIVEVLGAQLVPTTITTTDLKGITTTTTENLPIVLVGTKDAHGNRMLVEGVFKHGGFFDITTEGLNKNTDKLGFNGFPDAESFVREVNSIDALNMQNSLLDQYPGTHYLYNPALVIIPNSNDAGVANARAGKPTYGVFRNADQLATTQIDGAKLIEFGEIAQLVNQATK